MSAAAFTKSWLATLGRMCRQDPQPHWEIEPVEWTAETLGINLPWLDRHTGDDFRSVSNWFDSSYDSKLVAADLAAIEAMGIRRIRSFCLMEWVFAFRDGAFREVPANTRNLDDFLNRAADCGIEVIPVMSDGNSGGGPAGDGFNWQLIQHREGLDVYADGYAAYVARFSRHKNIGMWEIHNEPYGALTWGTVPKSLGVTQEQVHEYLRVAYTRLKPLAGTVPVGFSEMEEQQQDKYHLFGNAAKRQLLVDDCTDVYAMHIYRAWPDEVEDFRSLDGKPKWAVEVGSYNYWDPWAVHHPVVGRDELYHEDKNYRAFTRLAQKLRNSGFTLIMPWAFSSNPGLVKHNVDGSHRFGALAQYMKRALTGS